MQKKIFEPLGLFFDDIKEDSENTEYSAYSFTTGKYFVKFRVAKITPTKTGQFVTFYKREQGIIVPYAESDEIDFFMVNARFQNTLGLFLFPKDVLIAQGILSTRVKKGKLAFRVYPPWDIVLNKQARKTQEWQLQYFIAIEPKADLQKMSVILKHEK